MFLKNINEFCRICKKYKDTFNKSFIDMIYKERLLKEFCMFHKNKLYEDRLNKLKRKEKN